MRGVQHMLSKQVEQNYFASAQNAKLTELRGIMLSQMKSNLVQFC